MCPCWKSQVKETVAVRGISVAAKPLADSAAFCVRPGNSLGRVFRAFGSERRREDDDLSGAAGSPLGLCELL